MFFWNWIVYVLGGIGFGKFISVFIVLLGGIFFIFNKLVMIFEKIGVVIWLL